MLRNIVFLILATSALGAVLIADQQRPLDGRIVGGLSTDIVSFPYQVSLQSGGQHLCGAAVYSRKIIITAAHCLELPIFKDYTIRAGSSKWNSSGILVKVAAYKMHEKYDTNSSDNDIAVIRLEAPLNFSSAIRPISLASKEPVTGTPAVITGWGTTYEGAPFLPDVLRFANVKIIATKLCSTGYTYKSSLIKPSMICAAAPGKDHCNADSGGPLVAGGQLVGVVSFGFGCADPIYPGIYANVAYLKKWIENAAAEV